MNKTDENHEKMMWKSSVGCGKISGMKQKYVPAYKFDRTEEEKRDIFKSWARDDQAFFANGACHILAELFRQLHQNEGFYCIHIKPADGLPGNHWYATNGDWDFDHNGWVKESRIREVLEAAYKDRYPGWSCDYVQVSSEIGEFERYCQSINHRLPWQVCLFAVGEGIQVHSDISRCSTS